MGEIIIIFILTKMTICDSNKLMLSEIAFAEFFECLCAQFENFFRFNRSVFHLLIYRKAAPSTIQLSLFSTFSHKARLMGPLQLLSSNPAPL